MSGTKVMAQKARYAEKSKNCMSLPLAAGAARDKPSARTCWRESLLAQTSNNFMQN